MAIKTRFFLTSDTHGRVFDVKPTFKADVAIHCGDLTGRSELEKLRDTIDMMRKIPAPLKLVIAGNHDLLLEEGERFAELKSMSMSSSRDPARVDRTIGPAGAGRQLFEQAKADGVYFLDEGNYTFTLQNGACLRIYASPWTPAKWTGRAYQYPPETKHDFAIDDGTQVVVSHGPPLGVFDNTSFGRAGDPNLFTSVAIARPMLHCFGHIHSGWGAMLATWRSPRPRARPRYTDLNTEKSLVIEEMSNLAKNSNDTDKEAKARADKTKAIQDQGFAHTSHCSGDAHPLRPTEQTLFVNASYDWSESGWAGGLGEKPPWLVDLELPKAE
ncbi:hypothetical protein PG989_004187 [Apiospora arundinis]